MCARPNMPPLRDADTPRSYHCRACGVTGPAAVIAYPYDGGCPVALCVTCARERVHLRELGPGARLAPGA
jgi:hypothetical protein